MFDFESIDCHYQDRIINILPEAILREGIEIITKVLDVLAGFSKDRQDICFRRADFKTV